MQHAIQHVKKTTIGSLRKDQPVYLYDQKKALSIRATNLLRKKWLY